MAKRPVEPNKSGLHSESLRFGDESPINFYGNPVSTEAANEIISEVRAAIERGHDDEKAVRSLSRFVANYAWVLQLGEMHEYLNWLVRKRQDDVIRRLINEPQRRGRRHEKKALLVHLMRATIAAENAIVPTSGGDAGRRCWCSTRRERDARVCFAFFRGPLRRCMPRSLRIWPRRQARTRSGHSSGDQVEPSGRSFAASINLAVYSSGSSPPSPTVPSASGV